MTPKHSVLSRRPRSRSKDLRYSVESTTGLSVPDSSFAEWQDWRPARALVQPKIQLLLESTRATGQHETVHESLWSPDSRTRSGDDAIGGGGVFLRQFIPDEESDPQLRAHLNSMSSIEDYVTLFRRLIVGVAHEPYQGKRCEENSGHAQQALLHPLIVLLCLGEFYLRGQAIRTANFFSSRISIATLCVTFSANGAAMRKSKSSLLSARTLEIGFFGTSHHRTILVARCVSFSAVTRMLCAVLIESRSRCSNSAKRAGSSRRWNFLPRGI
jgi:hypothetical protein